MAKSLLRLEARKLRKRGVSVGKIAEVLGVAKSTVSWWVRDIVLTPQQHEKLKKSEQAGRELGRLKVALIQMEKRLKRIENAKQAGIRMIACLNERELFLAGLALYWAEGGKSLKNKRVEFCNSDPRMVKFLILWLKKCLGVKNEDLRAVVGINQIHEAREQKVREYWSEISGILLAQFRKTSYKRINNKKIYENFEDHYGTLSVLVAKSTDLYFRVMGLIEGFILAKLRQRSSVGERSPHKA